MDGNTRPIVPGKLKKKKKHERSEALYKQFRFQQKQKATKSHESNRRAM